VGVGVGARQYVQTGRAANLGQTRSLSRATATSTRPRDAVRADGSGAETLVAPAPPASHPTHTFPSPSSNWPLHRRLCLSRAAHCYRGRWWPARREIGRRWRPHENSRSQRLSRAALLEQRCAVEYRWRARGHSERNQRRPPPLTPPHKGEGNTPSVECGYRITCVRRRAGTRPRSWRCARRARERRRSGAARRRCAQAARDSSPSPRACRRRCGGAADAPRGRRWR
jgi:hypothetical protein